MGFTPVESAAYVFLVTHGSATGYAVAKGIGKGVANTYKALDSLASKGATIIEDGQNRTYHATPPAELLERLGAMYDDKLETAKAALRMLDAPATDDRVYQLSTVEQVFAKAGAMLKECSTVAMVDAFPDSLARISRDLIDASARGAKVAALVYETIELPGVELFPHYRADEVKKHWRGSWLNVATDGTEYLLAFFDPSLEKVRHAVWTGSPFLAHLYDSGLAAEIGYSALHAAVVSGGSHRQAKNVLSRLEPFMARATLGAQLVNSPVPQPRLPRGKQASKRR